MQCLRPLQHGGIIRFAVAAVTGVELDRHGVHLGRAGYAVLDVEKVLPDAQGDGGQCDHQRQRLLPAAAEDAERLLQQHLSGEEAQQAHDRLAQQELHYAADQTAQQCYAEEQAQAQTAAQTHGPPDDGPQPAEGDGVTGGLTGPSAVQEPAQSQQRQSHDGIDQQGGHAALRQDAEIDLLPLPRHQNVGVAANGGGQAGDGRQPDHRHGESGALKAKVEPALKELHHDAYQQNNAVGRTVQHRYGQQPAGGHGAQSAQRQEE